jgi:hypothetical protein
MRNAPRTENREPQDAADRAAALADQADSVAKATLIAATAIKASAAVAAPTGFAALKVALGVAAAPLVVKLAPIFFAVLSAAVALSAAISLYAKSKKKQAKGSGLGR